MKHEIIPTKNPNVAIDRNDPEHAKTAIELEWPETFSRRAKMVIRYFECELPEKLSLDLI